MTHAPPISSVITLLVANTNVVLFWGPRGRVRSPYGTGIKVGSKNLFLFLELYAKICNLQVWSKNPFLCPVLYTKIFNLQMHEKCLKTGKQTLYC